MSASSLPQIPRDILIKNKSENMCSYCKLNFSCGILKNLLTRLGAEVQKTADKEVTAAVLRFQVKLQNYGYNYPKAQRFCWTHDKKTVVSSLITEATQLLETAQQASKTLPRVSYRIASSTK